MVTSRRDVILKKKAIAASRRDAGGSFATKSSPPTVNEFSEVVGVDAWILKRALSEANSISALGAAIASNPDTPSPELVRSLQAEENWWRRIENELPSISSTETAALLGAKATNRNFASSQRSAGRLIGYPRRHAIRYPKFQFDLQRGTVLPVIPELVALTRGLDVPDEDLVLWMATPSSAFADQRRPVDHLNDREQLLAAAEAHFGAIW
ncbi:hypothetical protein VUN82_05390 [Micrococcaceae bacterium Sec5.1]